MDDRIASLALENLVQQLERHVEFFPQMREQVGPFRTELKKMSRLLSNLKEQELEDLTTEAYAAEDAIDDFVLNFAQKRRSRVGRLVHSLCHKHKLGDGTTKLDIIEQKLRNICNKNPADDNGCGSLHCRVSTGDDVVGFSKEAEALVQQLKSGDSVKQLEVFSIIGMEGLGKTTFATKIFNDNSIQGHFDCRMWVPVPREYKTEELFRCILDQVRTEDSDCYENEEDLKEVIFRCLEGKRFLIVIDNLCKKQVWDELKPAFPDESKGSRILLTSRLVEVASRAGLRPPISLPFLDKECSWELLRKTALKEESCPPELESIGKQIAAKCDGLPIAIVLLGGILKRMEKSTEKWQRLADNVGKYLMDSKRSKGVALSYHNLPEHLKICLLYFGTFPEDMDISARKLIQLWIAEGFIEQKGNRKMEDLGEEYLEGLIGRSLIQVSCRRTDGGVKTCRILSLLRELCICTADTKNFYQVLCTIPNPISPTQREVLRLSILDGCGSLMNTTTVAVLPNHSKLRSLQCYNDQINSTTLFGFNSLRVLNMGTIIVDRIPKGVKKLIHLKYLRVNAPKLTHIPPSICNLLKLLTLDMRESHVHSIPNGIWKMKSLRHLYLASFTSLPTPPEANNINKALSNIQTLSGVCPDTVLKRLMVKAKFPNVTRLRICSSNKEATLDFLQSIDHLCHLHSLKIVNPSHLPEDPHAFPSTLTKITLLQTNLQPDCMRTLEKLPNLRILKLLKGSVDSTSEAGISCNEDSFWQLQLLQLVDLKIEKWIMDSGALRSLEKLVIKTCDRLETLPDHLWSITTLQEVDVFHPSTKLRETLQKLEGVAGRNIRIHPPTQS